MRLVAAKFLQQACASMLHADSLLPLPCSPHSRPQEFAEGQQLCMLPCLHKYHGTCIQTWLKQKATCPVCQQKL